MTRNSSTMYVNSSNSPQPKHKSEISPQVTCTERNKSAEEKDNLTLTLKRRKKAAKP